MGTGELVGALLDEVSDARGDLRPLVEGGLGQEFALGRAALSVAVPADSGGTTASTGRWVCTDRTRGP